MKIFAQIKRLNFIHTIIKEERTGSPEVFAERLSISKRHLYNIIDELKLKGAPIYFDSKIGSYCYEKEFILEVDVKFDFVCKNEMKDINGGIFLPECNFISPDSIKFVIVSQVSGLSKINHLIS